MLFDSSVWSDKFRPRITAFNTKWKVSAVGKRTGMDGTSAIKLLQNQKQFSGKSVKFLMVKCDEMATWMSMVDEEL